MVSQTQKSNKHKQKHTHKLAQTHIQDTSLSLGLDVRCERPVSVIRHLGLFLRGRTYITTCSVLRDNHISIGRQTYACPSYAGHLSKRAGNCSIARGCHVRLSTFILSTFFKTKYPRNGRAKFPIIMFR